MLHSLSLCTRRAFAKYFKLELEDFGYKFNNEIRSINTLIGTAVHDCIEGFLLKGTYDIIKETSFLDDNDIKYDKTTPDKDTAFTQINNMINSYTQNFKFKPTATELELTCEIDDNFILNGFIDILYNDTIIDLKTGNSPQNYSLQLGAYSLMYRSVYYKDIDNLFVHFIKRQSLKRPQKKPVVYEYDIKHCQLEAIKVIEKIMDLWTFFIKTKDVNVFHKNYRSYLCNKNSCVAFDTDFCREREC